MHCSEVSHVSIADINGTYSTHLVGERPSSRRPANPLTGKFRCRAFGGRRGLRLIARGAGPVSIFGLFSHLAVAAEGVRGNSSAMSA